MKFNEFSKLLKKINDKENWGDWDVESIYQGYIEDLQGELCQWDLELLVFNDYAYHCNATKKERAILNKISFTKEDLYD